MSHPLSEAVPQCRVRNHPGLEALGVDGVSVDLRVELDVLHLDGTTAGSLAVTPEAVCRLRFFREPPRLRSSGYAQVEIWRQGDHPPLSIDTLGSDAAAFRHVVAAFARAVATARGASALEVGATGFPAIQKRAQLIIGALAWLAVLGAAMWVLTGLARILCLAVLLAICWSEGRRIRAVWRAGSLWRRDVHDLADFLTCVEQRGIPG